MLWRRRADYSENHPTFICYLFNSFSFPFFTDRQYSMVRWYEYWCIKGLSLQDIHKGRTFNIHVKCTAQKLFYLKNDDKIEILVVVLSEYHGFTYFQHFSLYLLVALPWWYLDHMTDIILKVMPPSCRNFHPHTAIEDRLLFLPCWLQTYSLLLNLRFFYFFPS